MNSLSCKASPGVRSRHDAASHTGVQEIEVGTDIVYTYDVHWQPSQIKWASRWDAYLRMPGGKVGKLQGDACACVYVGVLDGGKVCKLKSAASACRCGCGRVYVPRAACSKRQATPISATVGRCLVFETCFT